jgi:hypothetical protein
LEELVQSSSNRGLFARLLEARFASKRRAVLALVATILGFHFFAWLVHELMNPGHHAPVSFVAHLRHLPAELALQLLFMPLALHFAVPALFHPGNLFEWNPGYLAPRIFAVLYWSTLIASAVAVVRGRRVVWWLLIVALLLASTPRFVELIFVTLSET